MKLGLVTLLVKDYDEAIAYFCDKMGFELIEDTPINNQKRWVVISSENGAALLLAKASNDKEQKQIGQAAGGRVAYFLYVADFDQTYEQYKSNGVEFLENPRHENYGKVVQFADLYGNKWDLIQAKN